MHPLEKFSASEIGNPLSRRGQVISGHLIDFPFATGRHEPLTGAESPGDLQLHNSEESGHAVRSVPAGCVVIDSVGKIVWCGERDRLPTNYRQYPRVDYGEKWILPGFVDAHVHFPQYRMLASYGENLLDWLTRFTFPEEVAYENEPFAEQSASTFLTHLYRVGTTSCLCFATTHVASVDAIFQAAAARNMALISGKTLMDRGAPVGLLERYDHYITDCRKLIETWHGKERLKYAISPRFAITSSESQLERCGQLASDFPDLIIQTHLSESLPEVETVKRLFPWAANYTEVYHRFGLVRERSLFAHGIHLSADEKSLLSDRGAGIIHCPTSNTFLGSGLFPWKANRKSHSLRVGLGSDIGAGTSYSMLQNMKEAYSISQLVGGRLSVSELFGTATLGNAQLLGLDDEIGTLEPGKFADLIVIDPKATELLRDRAPLSKDLHDQLFSLLILGDDRVVEETYVAGLAQKSRASLLDGQYSTHNRRRKT
ncbi:MAG: guanine deaminase [Pirellula sp.]|jgi:guanine deaminase|nr:guanine deaminase [Pirellula sp.]